LRHPVFRIYPVLHVLTSKLLPGDVRFSLDERRQELIKSIHYEASSIASFNNSGGNVLRALTT
jgi:hypothetical protein